MIFINGFSQTRDIDYYINYEKAEVRFINKTIPDNQKVEIAYNIYESDKPNKKNVNAYAIESHYSPNNHIQVTNKYQTTDPNFLPIGNININKGTSKFIHEINWLMNQNESASFLYENESIQSIDYENRYKKHHYLSTLNFNLFIFDTSHEILYDDITSSNNYKESTKKVIKYENTFNYNFSDDNINISNSISQKNERPQIDTSLNSLITSSKIEYNNNFKIKKWINSGTISPYFSKSTDKTNKKDTSSYQQKNVENIGFNASTKMNDQIQNMTTFDKGTYQTLLTSDEKFIDTYYNYSHNSTITPFPWLNSNVNISHEESISPIPGQENKVEDREGYNIVQLANDAALEYLNAPSFILSRFKGSYSNLGLSKTKKRENNRLKNYKENRYFGAINALKPFEGFNIPKFKFDTYNSTLSDKKTSTYQTFSSSNTKFYSYDTGFTFRPNLHHLNRLSFDSTLTESKSNVLSNLTLTTGTTNTTTSVVYNQTQKFGVNINAPTIPLLITSIMSPSIRLEQNKKTKIDENNTQSSDPTNNAFLLDNNLIKENKLKLNYKVFRIFKLTNSASDEESYYNRNKISTIKGSVFRKK